MDSPRHFVAVLSPEFVKAFGVWPLWSGEGAVGLVFAVSDAEIVLSFPLCPAYPSKQGVPPYLPGFKPWAEFSSPFGFGGNQSSKGSLT